MIKNMKTPICQIKSYENRKYFIFNERPMKQSIPQQSYCGIIPYLFYLPTVESTVLMSGLICQSLSQHRRIKSAICLGQSAGI